MKFYQTINETEIKCNLFNFRCILCPFAAFFYLLVFSQVTVRLTSQDHRKKNLTL